MSLDIPESDGLTNSLPNIADKPVDPESDRLIPRQIASGTSRGIQQLGSDRVYSDGGNNQIIVEDETNPKVLMGNQATFGEGFYVAKDGINAKTNTDPSQWIFNSNQNTLKVVLASSISVNISSISSNSTNTTTIPHGLTSTPAFLAYVTLPSNFPTNYTPSLSAVVQMPTIAFAGTATLLWVAARVDVTNLYLDVYNASAGTVTGPYVFNFKYYILQETAI